MFRGRSWPSLCTMALGIAILIVGLFVLHPVYVNVCDGGDHGTGQSASHITYSKAILKVAQILSHAETWTAFLQRAYLTVEPRGIEITTAGHVIGQVAIKNVGHLPARGMSNEARIEWYLDRNMTFGELDVPHSDVVLPVQTAMPRGTGALEENGKAEFLACAGYLYVWGKVLYQDGFNTPRWLKFCHRYNSSSPRNGQGGIDVVYARYHHHHNDGD